MIYLGLVQDLYVKKRTDFGFYLEPVETCVERGKLSDEKLEEAMIPEMRILLPKNEAGNVSVGQKVSVFVYLDSSDRPIATTKRPKLTLGNYATLKVAQVNKVGAFLDWGLLKDLFLPFEEQTRKVSEGDEVIVALYLDKSKRLCATMHVYPYLETDANYEKGALVTGRVYEIIPNFGAFVAVNDRYQALIPKHRLFSKLEVGEVIKARVERVLQDGKVELAIRENKALQTTPDSEIIYKMLKENKGYLPYHDKTDPELIKEIFGMSKAAFKRAIGSLYKEKKIEILESGIRIPKEH
ncbi:MAG: S1-like domain-containing RNA-binding protein [Lachnospiraceae bacterium]|nr:S1-like domain-containing RNA-binding protein [Lachnospiraceae bacterium]